MIKTTNRPHRCGRAGFALFICLLFVGVILVTAPQSYAQKVVDGEHRDPAIEAQLDDYLIAVSNSNQSGLQQLAPIINQLKPQTPVLTRIRAMANWGLEHGYDEQYQRADEILAEVSGVAADAGLVEGEAEVLAVDINLLTLQGEFGQAMLQVPELERLLEKIDLPRLSYYGHNLISLVYLDWDRYKPALTHLIAAQEALGQMQLADSHRRRLQLMSRMAQIQTRLEQWDEAIATVEDSIPQAMDAELDGIAFNLWFTRYYAQLSAGQLEAALGSLTNAYRLAEELQLDHNKAIVLNNFGDLYMRLERYDEARQHLEEAKAEAAALGFDDMLKTIEFNLGFIAVKEGDSLGIQQMENVVGYFRQSLSDMELSQFLGELATAYGLVGRHKQQAQLLNERIELKEKAIQRAQQNKMAELQALYKSRDKAQQIELLEQQNSLKEQIIRNNEQRTLIWLLLAAVGGVSIALMLVLYRKSRQANLKLNKANEQLADQSLRDPLTGLWNRRALQEAMVERSQQTHVTVDGLILLDLDFFKRINDRYGHAIGDKVLKEACHRLSAVCRGSDKLIRWGGEEFLFYIKDIDNQQLSALAKRILECIGETPFKADGNELKVTATIGFIQLPFANLSEELVDWERALQIADMALYTGKAHGRNRACGVIDLNVSYDQAHAALEHDLSAAIDNDWVVVSNIDGPQKTDTE